MAHLELRRRRYYAVHDVPADVQAILRRKRYVQSTKTGSYAAARIVLLELEAVWRKNIEQARGNLPPEAIAPDDPHLLVRMLGEQYAQAHDDGDEGVMLAIEDAAIEEARNLPLFERREYYERATAKKPVPSPPKAPTATALAPLVTEWKVTLKNAKKTVDQQYRDVSRMAARIKSLENLTTGEVKKWVEEMREEGKTWATFDRVGKACRSFWAYLVDEDHRKEEDTNPFDGLFRSARKKAPRNTAGRTATVYTDDEVLKLYEAALAKKDQPLADLIALGAYTGARIEELCKLTKKTAEGGLFRYGTKTKASKREVPILDNIKPLVERLMVEADEEGFLIPSTADNQYGTRSGPLSQRFGHLKTALGFGKTHTFHNLRATLITQLCRAGADPTTVKDIAGHRRGDFTEDNYMAGTLYADRKEALALVTYPGALGQPR